MPETVICAPVRTAVGRDDGQIGRLILDKVVSEPAPEPAPAEG